MTEATDDVVIGSAILQGPLSAGKREVGDPG
jgi:hypothetical protein